MSRQVLGRAGEIIANYELLELLGTSAEGQVFRARHRSRPAFAAIKIEPVDDDAERARQCAVEAEALQAIRHPAVVRVLDQGADPTRSYLVMELLEGRSAQRLLRDGPLHPLRALQIAIQGACGLMVAHGHGVVHGDVKPQNLLWVPAEHTVKLVGFGSGKLIRRGDATAPEHRGALAFAAPERLGDPPVTDDPRLDVYGLGLTVWNLLHGAHPFGDVLRSEPCLIDAQLHRMPAALAGKLPRHLDEVLEPMFAKNPGERYETMGLACAALLDALRRLEEDVGPGSRRWPPLEGMPVSLQGLRLLFARSKGEAQAAAARRAPTLPRSAPAAAPAPAPARAEPVPADDITVPLSPRPVLVTAMPSYLAMEAAMALEPDELDRTDVLPLRAPLGEDALPAPVRLPPLPFRSPPPPLRRPGRRKPARWTVLLGVLVGGIGLALLVAYERRGIGAPAPASTESDIPAPAPPAPDRSTESPAPSGAPAAPAAAPSAAPLPEAPSARPPTRRPRPSVIARTAAPSAAPSATGFTKRRLFGE